MTRVFTDVVVALEPTYPWCHSMKHRPHQVTVVSWLQVRERVAGVNPVLAALIDDIDPDPNLPLYCVNYPYGALLLEHGKWRFPDSMTAQHDLPKAFCYAQGGMPTGLVLAGATELFWAGDGRIFPWRVLQAGMCLHADGLLVEPVETVPVPLLALSMTAGARSICFIPCVSDAYQHKNLLRDFGLRIPAPRELLQQWSVFKALAQHPASGCDWQVELLLFPSTWIERLRHDTAWRALSLHLLTEAWQRSGYARHLPFYHYLFSMAQAHKQLKSSAHLTDTFKHLLAIASGYSLGFAAATDDTLAPVSLLQQAYMHSYGLKKYVPTLMQPATFAGSDAKPVYYSLQLPTAFEFSPRGKQVSNTLQDLRELHALFVAFRDVMSHPSALLQGAPACVQWPQLELDFFHSKVDPLGEIQLTDQLPAQDAGLLCDAMGEFCKTGTFLRGCVRISKAAE